jgi:hypothetical protein
VASKNSKLKFQEWKDEMDRKALAEAVAKEREWPDLGNGYPGDDVLIRAAFDVLAPVFDDSNHPMLDDDGNRLPPERVPVYEVSVQETPSPKEVWELATNIARAVMRAGV